jgi:hypothetical protein
MIMTARKNVFKDDRMLIANVDVDGPLASPKTPCCDYYSTVYATAAQQALACGEANNGAVYAFLHALVSFHPSFDTPPQPFVPWVQMEGKRRLIPSDRTADDIDALRALSRVSSDPTLRSRLLDILWEQTKDHTACAEAAAGYIEAAEKLNSPDNLIFSVSCYQRALYLASKLRRKKELFKRANARQQQR